MRALASRLRTAAWLGWQIESNWADHLTFVVYTVLRPLATSLILAGMYWAVAGHAPRRGAFMAFYLANAFHEYVTRVVVGTGWVVVEEREEYETLKYVYTSPIGMMTYFTGRSAVKFVLASIGTLLTLVVGWFLLGLRWDWSAVQWPALLLALLLGLFSTANFALLMAGWALLLPRIAITVNEGVAVALYLLCGVIFPVDLLPRALQWISLALPFTWWYESLRRFLLGSGASTMLSHLSGAELLGALTLTTLVFTVASRWGYLALERRARQLGRLDQTTLF